jgi:lysozyme
MKVNKAGIDLIKQFEGCKLRAYKCPAGVWTVGYGLTSAAGFIEVGPHTVITKAEAEWYLERALVKFAAKIKPAITAPITPNQFGAFVSLAYNIGPTAFKRSSALRHFNGGDLDKVPAAMRLWKKAGGKVVQGLVNRREDEIKLFLTPVEEPAPEPKPKPHWLADLVQTILSLFNSPRRD